MKSILFTILLIGLAFSACQQDKSTKSSDEFGIFNSDQKDEAAKIVETANDDLKKVRAIYNANDDKVSEIKAAMQNKEVEKVKAIADDLVKQINDGVETAKDAVKKIKQAEDMDINSTYKEYLGLKRRALESQIEAFELRRQVAKIISEAIGSKDPTKIDQSQAQFAEREKQFKKLMDDAKGSSDEANEVYKNSLHKN